MVSIMRLQSLPDSLQAAVRHTLRHWQHAALGRLARLLWTLVYRTTGRRLPATVDYRDSSSFSGTFDADATIVSRLVPPVFDIVESTPGRTSLRIEAIQNKEINIMAPYREILVGVPVRYQGMDTIDGIFPISLPVTTEAARWGGVKIAGFPKFLGEIEFESAATGMRTILTASGQHVLTLEVDEAPTATSKEDVRFFNIRDDSHVTESTFERSARSGESDHPGGARLELGTHPLAHVLRALDVGSESLAHEYAPKVSGRLRMPAVDHGPIGGTEAEAAPTTAHILDPPSP